MTSRTVLSATLAGSLLFVACGNGSSNRPGSTGGEQTISQAANAQIAGSTNDSGQAIEINQLSVSNADTDETSAPAAVN